MRQPAKANCTMPQPTAYADALGHYLYLPGWEGGLQVEGAPQCEKWRRKAGTKIARALQASALAPFRVKIRNRPGKAHAAKGRHPGWLLLLRLPRVRLSPLPPHIGQGPSETGKGARRSLAVLRPNTPPL